MRKYEIYKDNKSINIYGCDQCFNEEDIKSLWQEHKILYLKGGIIAVWVEERENMNPLIHLMREDDGHISWHKETDEMFDSSWLDNYIATLTEVKNKINTKNVKYIGLVDKNGHKLYLNCKVKIRNNFYKVVEHNGFFGKIDGEYVFELTNNIPFVVNHLDVKAFCGECEINKKMILD